MNETWKQKKKKTNKNKRNEFSVVKKLREQNKINEEFEMIFNRLSLEEILWLKLELSARVFANNKLYGFPIWHSLPNIMKESLLYFALYSTCSYREAARFLGVNEEYILQLINKYNVRGSLLK